MDRSVIKDELLVVLEQIQAISGEACPPLEGELRPAESLPRFNSKVWPVAAGMLSTAIGQPIPPETNLFVDEATKEPLTIDQIVDLVCEILERQRQVQDVAA
jgi:hypothetical protein